VSEPAAVVEGPIITSENPPIGGALLLPIPKIFQYLHQSGIKERKSIVKFQNKKIFQPLMYGGAEQIFFKGITAPPVIERTDRVSLQTLLPPCKRKTMMMTIKKKTCDR
jgi:hypothetical protein